MHIFEFRFRFFFSLASYVFAYLVSGNDIQYSNKRSELIRCTLLDDDEILNDLIFFSILLSRIIFRFFFWFFEKFPKSKSNQSSKVKAILLYLVVQREGEVFLLYKRG